MNFVKESVNQTPIVDTVFSIVAKAKEAKAKVGSENVVDATIGSLYDEEGTLVALDSVFSSLKNLDNKVLAAYAASFTGNPDFRQKVYDWVLNGNSHLEHEVIATPGVAITSCSKCEFPFNTQSYTFCLKSGFPVKLAA